jgi:hypothetical protein
VLFITIINVPSFGCLQLSVSLSITSMTRLLLFFCPLDFFSLFSFVTNMSHVTYLSRLWIFPEWKLQEEPFYNDFPHTCYHYHSNYFFKISIFVVSCTFDSNLGGAAPPDKSWKGSLNVSYNIGPGFTGSEYSR